MRALVVVLAGAADRPLQELGGRTPLEAARAPSLARLAAEGRIGRLHVAPSGQRPEEGAFAVALYGLDPRSYPDVGGLLHAAAFGVPVGSLDQAFSLSLVTADLDTMYDATAGHVTRDEAALLLGALSEAVPDTDLTFHPGDGWRNTLLWKGARDLRVRTVPPFDVVGKDLRSALPRGTGVARLTAAVERSHDVLSRHEVNELRRDLGENPATLVWPWAGGVATAFPSFRARTGRTAAFVGVEPSFLGAARLQEVHVERVEGATGLAGTNLRAKLAAALSLWERTDVVVLHVDALAAASHARDFAGKVEALERIDGTLVGPAVDAALAADGRLLLVAGPAVSTETGRPLLDPVPFAVLGKEPRSGRRAAFTEVGSRDGGFEVTQPHELLDFVLRS